MARSIGTQEPFDHLLKILLLGNSGVGKSSLLNRFASDEFEDNSQPTIGVDFKVKYVSVGGKRVKLTIWDTAGQERFRTLTSSYYRGAQGVIFTYDVTRPDTFSDLDDIWMRELDMYSTVEESVKMVVANKIDLETREVSKADGEMFARRQGCLFAETSAKADVAVSQAFEELILKILETPALLDGGPASHPKPNLGSTSASNATQSCCG